MGYLERNKNLQNIIAFLIGIGLLTIITIFTKKSSFNYFTDIAAALGSFFIYLGCLLVAGMIIGIIAFKKHGYLILGIQIPLMILGDFLYIIIDYYNQSPNELLMIDLLALIRLPLGGILVFIGGFLGILMKYKIQNGAQYSMLIIKDNFLKKAFRKIFE